MTSHSQCIPRKKELKAPCPSGLRSCQELKCNEVLPVKACPLQTYSFITVGLWKTCCEPAQSTARGCFRKALKLAGFRTAAGGPSAHLLRCTWTLHFLAPSSRRRPGSRRLLGVAVSLLASRRAGTPPPSLPFGVVRCLLVDEVSLQPLRGAAPWRGTTTSTWRCVFGCQSWAESIAIGLVNMFLLIVYVLQVLSIGDSCIRSSKYIR